MEGKMGCWTTSSLYEAVLGEPLFSNGEAVVELIDGVEPALHVVMSEYGDLPIFLTVAGEQIIVEAVLWTVSDVNDVALFNEAVLRTHMYFPLSTIGLDRHPHNGSGGLGECYHMFGALSSTSTLKNVVFEIEMLANNVIQATEAYSEFLSIPVETN